MTAEIISIGTELLLGDVVDTNAAFLSRELAGLGISVYRRTTVGDNKERLVKAIESAFFGANLVVTTGGLGPTVDDITRESVAEYFGLGLKIDREIEEGLREYFKGRGNVMTENNLKQACVPEGGQALKNENGTAPGILIEKDGKTIILLPGPPAEAEPMFHTQVYPILKVRQKMVFLSKTLRMCGIGESAMETAVRDILDRQGNPTIAPYAGGGETRLRLTAGAKIPQVAAALIEPVKAELYARLCNYIYGEDEDTIEGVVVRLLKEKGLTLSCAESCTGGMLSARITSVTGASSVFTECAVTYCDKAKTARLNVPEDVLLRCGAVSEETAGLMARGIADAAGTDMGIAITGIAGPEGGSQEKPVGTVCFGLLYNGIIYTKTTHTPGNRERVRTRAVAEVLAALWRALTDKEVW